MVSQFRKQGSGNCHLQANWVNCLGRFHGWSVLSMCGAGEAVEEGFTCLTWKKGIREKSVPLGNRKRRSPLACSTERCTCGILRVHPSPTAALSQKLAHGFVFHSRCIRLCDTRWHRANTLWKTPCALARRGHFTVVPMLDVLPISFPWGAVGAFLFLSFLDPRDCATCREELFFGNTKKRLAPHLGRCYYISRFQGTCASSSIG